MHGYPMGHPSPLQESKQVLQAGVSSQSLNDGVTQASKTKGTSVTVIPTGTALLHPGILHPRVPTKLSPHSLHSN